MYFLQVSGICAQYKLDRELLPKLILLTKIVVTELDSLYQLLRALTTASYTQYIDNPFSVFEIDVTGTEPSFDQFHNFYKGNQGLPLFLYTIFRNYCILIYYYLCYAVAICPISRLAYRYYCHSIITQQDSYSIITQQNSQGPILPTPSFSLLSLTYIESQGTQRQQQNWLLATTPTDRYIANLFKIPSTPSCITEPISIKLKTIISEILYTEQDYRLTVQPRIGLLYIDQLNILTILLDPTPRGRNALGNLVINSKPYILVVHFYCDQFASQLSC